MIGSNVSIVSGSATTIWPPLADAAMGFAATVGATVGAAGGAVAAGAAGGVVGFTAGGVVGAAAGGAAGAAGLHAASTLRPTPPPRRRSAVRRLKLRVAGSVSMRRLSVI